MSHTDYSAETLVTFQADLFSNREEEKQLFFDTVRAKVKRTYLEFTGVAGQGKSELLKWIFHHAAEREYAAAYIDFELAEYHSKELAPILTTIAAQLEQQTSSDAFRKFYESLELYQQELRQIYRQTLMEEQAPDRRFLNSLEDTCISVFNEVLARLLDKKKVVFCLDSTEKAYRTILQSFEERVVTRYTAHPNFILITAGQEELVWKSHEIRNLVQQYELPCLDPHGVQQQVKALAQKKGVKVADDDLVLNTMLDLTQGHPFSAYKLIDLWTEGFQAAEVNKSVIETQFARSISELSQRVIRERILKKFELSQDYPPMTDILWYLAPLRHIEFDTFKFVLSTFLGEWFAGKRYIFFQQLMGEFHRSYIFKRWHLGSGFDMDPVVRNILLWDMRINAPQTFQEVEKTLADQFDAWIGKTHDATQIRNVVERLYHYAAYLRETGQPDVDELTQQELRRYLDAYFYADVPEDRKPLYNQLNRLYNTLEEDKDLALLTDRAALLECITLVVPSVL